MKSACSDCGQRSMPRAHCGCKREKAVWARVKTRIWRSLTLRITGKSLIGLPGPVVLKWWWREELWDWENGLIETSGGDILRNIKRESGLAFS